MKKNRVVLFFAMVFQVVFLMFVWVFSAFLEAYRKWKFRKAPQSCCRAGCATCPWGNPKGAKEAQKRIAEWEKGKQEE